MIPGEFLLAAGDIEINAGAERVTLMVANTGDRPVQVGSHYHFAEANAALRFDREKARGRRLDIAAGTAVRFEPGETKTVALVPIAGNQVIRGGNHLADGAVSDANRAAFMDRVTTNGFAHR